ncbi:MAG: DUF4274 domain-containing protein [Novosphingobium sp.]
MYAASPDQWHQAAQSWNFDNATHWLKWIVEQPQCDLGTALNIFWRTEPTWNLSHLNPFRKQMHGVSIDAEALPIQIIILGRWVRNEFTRAEIAFEGRQIHSSNKPHLVPIVPFEVLEEMALPRKGRIVERGDFDEGIPFEVVAAYRKAREIDPE